jgi:metallo-beta-lactamase family protein
LNWLSHFERPPIKTFVTHGELSAADAMRLRIQDRFKWEAHTPEHLETVEF